MSVDAVKFNVKDRPEFFKVLRKRVNQHFKENNISKYGNAKMQIKSVFMICLYFLRDQQGCMLGKVDHLLVLLDWYLVF